jgi:multicomponent Na+:H+ antiporter subunit F
MILSSTAIPSLGPYFMLIALSVGMLLAMYRLVRGPSLPDRIVALDVMATLLVGLIALYSIAYSDPAPIRVAMVLALIGFVGTVAFAYYIQKRAAQ